MNAKKKRNAPPAANGVSRQSAAPPEEEGEEIKSRVVPVTPEKAKRWLERNHPDNRETSWARIEVFADDMRASKWKLTHQGIAFDGEGRLIDGQHRLMAVVASGATVRMMVVWNVGAFGDPIDCGRPRSIATLAGVHGRDVATVNCLRMLENGVGDTKPMSLASYQEVSAHHAVSVAAVGAIPYSHKMIAGLRAGLAYAHPIAPEAVLEFGGQVVSGERLVRGEPAFALFHWKDANKNLRTWDSAMATLNAARHALSGLPLRALYTGPTGYRGITSKRRAMRVPHTPSTTLVESGNAKPTAAPHVKREAAEAPPARALMTFEDE